MQSFMWLFQSIASKTAVKHCGSCDGDLNIRLWHCYSFILLAGVYQRFIISVLLTGTLIYGATALSVGGFIRQLAL